jgi:diguanylate cyclase (GGDEF)-like protein
MPEKLQGIAFHSVVSRFSLQEGVVAGIGVLLFFLGVWSTSISTKLFCFLITGIALYYIFESFRSKKASAPAERDLDFGHGSVENDLPVPPVGAAKSVLFEPVRKEDVGDHPSPPAMVENFVNHEENEIRFEEPIQIPVKTVEYTVSDFVDDDQSSIGGGQPEPKSEFNFLLQKIVSVAKEVTFANSVSFFWVNREARQLVLEGKITDSEAFTSSRKIPMGNDVVSQIALTGKPEIVSQIALNAERDIVPYYTSLQEIRSFVGVPIYYPQSSGERLPVAVLSVDSKADDAFGQETLALLTQFTKMLSAVLKSSTEKYDLITESELLKAAKRFRLKAFGDPEISNIGNALAEETSMLVPWDALTLTLFDDTQKQWVIANVRTRHNHRYVVAKQVLDFHASVVGNAIKNNTVQNIGDMSKTTEPRFLTNETSLGMARVGSFAAIPIASVNKCYGALTLECRDKDAYNSKEISVASHLTSIAGIALELHEANEIIREYVIVDEGTGTMSKKYLMQRLSEELQRADDNGSDVSFLFFGISSINDIISRYGKAGADAAVARVASILRSSIRSYDLIGRFEHSMFGVVLVNTTANDAYLWAEKLRSAIASSIVTLEQKSFSATVTVGICGATEGIDASECVSNAMQVLEKAKEAGGNIVRVF